MNFTYKAKSTTGAVTTGVIEASTAVEARRLLREQNLFALAVEAKAAVEAGVSKGASLAWFGGTRIGKADLLMLTTQLSIMCRAGIDLAEAFKNVSTECRKPALKTVLVGIYEDVASGSALSAALQRRSDVFGEAYVASIAAGEASGRVPDVLARQCELLRNEIRLRGALRGVLAYPCVLMLVAVIVFAALVFFVLPQFGDVFVSLEATAPPMTQLLLDGSQLVRSHWMPLLLVAAAGTFGLVCLVRTESFRRWFDERLLRTNFLRAATQPLLTGRTFRLIGTMLESGLPLLEAVRLARRSENNRVFRDVFDRMESEILLGNGIGRALAGTDLIPGGAVQLVTTAERSGDLGSVMTLVGEYYEEEGQREVQQRAKILEPLIIVAMGGVVAFVVASVMLPLLDVSGATG